MLLGEVVNNAGGWLNYIATLSLVERLDASRLHLSFVLLVRYLPFFFWAPVAGIVADRYRRDWNMVITCAVPALVVCCLALIHREDLWLLFVLLFIQFSLGAFYDPARRALIPQVVPPEQLHLAATMDTWVWSLMSAFGASIGGFVASRLGSSAAYLLDALSYVLAASFALAILGKVPGPGEPPLWQNACKKSHKSSDTLENLAPELVHPKLPGFEAPAVHTRMSDAMVTQVDHAVADDDSPDESSMPAAESSAQVAALQTEKAALPTVRPKVGGWGIVVEGFREELGAMKEGWAYMTSPGNRGIAALALLKGSGAWVWSAADVLNVLYAAMPRMQTLGNAQQTLGFIFAGVGVGCFFGPIISNWITKPEVMPMLRACVVSLGLMCAAWLGLTFATNVWIVIISTIVRGVGSATLWVYSTLLLQKNVPNALQGRVFALEMAFCTVAETASGVFPGIAIDDLHLSKRMPATVRLLQQIRAKVADWRQ
ncbi:hypothetical protein WJX73_005825 [Symbiochloris irregularis]|uniref:Uncharacterized protein n=1 Tax=Symbiochloris irregularis TaxID=706552 RepID=A0AAW1Q2Q8_9CHLO